MHSSPLLDNAHQTLDTIPEGFDEESWCPDSDFGQVSDRVPFQEEPLVATSDGGEESISELRTRLRRATTETLITNLHSIRPPSATDSRMIEVGILNEDMSKGRIRVTIRSLLWEVNRVGKESDALFMTNNPDSPKELFSPSKSTRRRRSSAAGMGTLTGVVGETAVRDRDLISELKMRDLRQLDSHFNHHEEPYVLIRRHCVLLSLGPHIRVIVQSRRLLILVHHDGAESEKQSQVLLNILADTIQELMKSSRLGMDFTDVNIPFEVKAYSALFTMYHSLLTKEYNNLLCHSKTMIASISDHTMLSVGLQEYMHTNHDNVVDLLSRVSGARRMIASLLEGENELLFLNLRVLDANPLLYGMSTEDATAELYANYSDIELIFESILVDYRTIENQAEVMERKLTNIEQSINLKLDTSRNELLFATTILSVFATTISFSGYITGVFGMNLDNTKEIQNTPGVFYGVFFSTLFLIAMGGGLIIFIFRHFHFLPTHAHLSKGIESDLFGRRIGEVKETLETSTKNLMHNRGISMLLSSKEH